MLKMLINNIRTYILLLSFNYIFLKLILSKYLVVYVSAVNELCPNEKKPGHTILTNSNNTNMNNLSSIKNNS